MFSIEANLPEAFRLKDYVLEGTGNPAGLLRGMYFWTRDTGEVLAMIRWMREFNQSGNGRVQFTGFDMQAPNVAAGIVRDFVARYDAGYGAAVGEAMTLQPPRRLAASGLLLFALDLRKVHRSGFVKHMAHAR